YLRVASNLAAHGMTSAGLGVPAALAANAYGGPAQALRHAVRDLPADLYIAHYVAALPAAAAAARRHGGMLGFDAEDFHSGEGTADPADDFRKALVETIEGACLPSCAHVTAAAPLIGSAYSARYGVSPVTV